MVRVDSRQNLLLQLPGYHGGELLEAPHVEAVLEARREELVFRVHPPEVDVAAI